MNIRADPPSIQSCVPLSPLQPYHVPLYIHSNAHGAADAKRPKAEGRVHVQPAVAIDIANTARDALVTITCLDEDEVRQRGVERVAIAGVRDVP